MSKEVKNKIVNKNKKSDSKKVESKKEKVKSVKSEKETIKKEDSSKKVVKKSSPKKIEEKDSITLEEADSFYHISLLAQAVCVVGILFISILAIFEHSFTVPIEVLVGITLLIMAYNNERVFIRRGLTVVYLIFGIVCLLVGIFGYFGVNV